MSDNKLTFEPVPDPLAETPLTGDVEADSKAEQDAMLAAFDKAAAKKGSFKAKEQAEKERRKYALQLDYYCCFVFQSCEQKTAFLKGMGLEDFGGRYLDGGKVAAKLGIPIPDHAIKFQGEKADGPMIQAFEPIESLPATYTGKAARKAKGGDSPR